MVAAIILRNSSLLKGLLIFVFISSYSLLADAVTVKLGISTTLSFLEAVNETFSVRKVSGKSNIVTVALALTAADEISKNSGEALDEIATGNCSIDFEFYVFDSVSNFALMLQQYQFLKSNDFDAIIGPKRSSESVPLSFISSVDEIPLIAYSATSAELDDKDTHQYFARTIPSDRSVANSIVDLLVRYEYEYASVLYVEDAYGSGYKNILFEAAEKVGITLGFYPFTKSDADSIRTALQQMKARGVKIFIAVVFFDELDVTMRTAYELGLTGEGFMWLFSDAIGQAGDIRDLIEGSGNPDILALALNGTIQIQAIGAVEENPNFQKFRNFYEQQKGFLGDINNLKQYLPGGAQNSEPSPVSEFLFTGNDFQQEVSQDFYNTTSFADFSLFAFDATVTIQRVLKLNGCDKASLKGANFIEALSRPDFPFEGVTGRIEFLQQTASRSLESAFVRAFNFISDANDPSNTFSAIRIGDYDGVNKWVLQANIKYPPGNVSVAPPETDQPVVIRNEISVAVEYFLYISTGFVYLLCLACAVWIKVNYRQSVVQASQPEFLLTVLFGVILTATSSLFLYTDEVRFTDEENAIRCNTFVGLLTFGLTLTISSVCAKLYRISRIIIQPGFRRVKITVEQVFCRIGGVLAINALIYGFAITLTPMEFIVVETEFDQFGLLEEKYAICSPKNTYAIFICLAVFIALQYLYGTYLGIKCRNIATDFQEGTYLSVSVLSQAQVGVLGIAVVIAIEENQTSVRVLVISMLVLLVNVVLVALLFFPKIFRIYIGDTEVMLTKRASHKVDLTTHKVSKVSYITPNGNTKTSRITDDDLDIEL